MYVNSLRVLPQAYTSRFKGKLLVPLTQARHTRSTYGEAQTEKRTITLHRDTLIEMNVAIAETSFMIDNVVVTANKYETKQREVATIVNVIPPLIIESTTSNSMADVLNFQTGLRVEETCSNCGVPQIRINGLEGQYTQILMDSRPIFSSLASVYGLEQLPAGMVDRIEVIRGGGSALYGANAIAGVVNIITKEPSRNSLNISNSSAFTQQGTYDINTNMNASVVSENQKAGLFLFGVQRNRQQYDRDNDASWKAAAAPLPPLRLPNGKRPVSAP